MEEGMIEFGMDWLLPELGYAKNSVVVQLLAEAEIDWFEDRSLVA